MARAGNIGTRREIACGGRQVLTLRWRVAAILVLGLGVIGAMLWFWPGDRLVPYEGRRLGTTNIRINALVPRDWQIKESEYESLGLRYVTFTPSEQLSWLPRTLRSWLRVPKPESAALILGLCRGGVAESDRHIYQFYTETAVMRADWGTQSISHSERRITDKSQSWKCAANYFRADKEEFARTSDTVLRSLTFR